jgi:TRAP-type mannitol/chloroaromatic compound transport system substrate-binding protein
MTNKRRQFLTHAAAAAAATAVLPSTAATPSRPVENASPLPDNWAAGKLVIKMQSSFPQYDIRNQAGARFVEKFNKLDPGVQIEYLPNGKVVPAGRVVPAMKEGKLDAAFTNTSYLHGTDPAFSLWSSGPAFGMDSNMLLAWHRYGGGKALLDKLYRKHGFELHTITTLPLPTQPFGWTKKPIYRLEDLRGLKFRTAGLALDVYKELGAVPSSAPAENLTKMLQSGELDAAEFNNLTSDKALELNKAAAICMVQGYTEATGVMEISFSKKLWDSLGERTRTLIESLASAVSAEGSWDIIEQNSRDYEALARSGTQFLRTPPTILQAQLNAWDRVISRYVKENPIFAEVVKSQKEYAERAARWNADIQVDPRPVYNHYFNKKVT